LNGTATTPDSDEEHTPEPSYLRPSRHDPCATVALIVNVSSGLAFVPIPIAPVYCATKAALHSFSQSLRAQLAGTGVTVVELAPPGVETPLFREEFSEETKG